MDDLLADFIAETRDTLDAIAGELVAWEAAPDDRERLDAIFRFVHTVKGSCGFLDLPRLQRLSHAAEDVLAEVRGGKRQPDRALVSAVLGIVDRIGELTESMASGAPLADGDDGTLLAALHGGSADARPAAAAAVTPTRSVARSIRLPVELLDRMMAGVSDMVLARNELARRLREEGAHSATEVAFERVSVCIAEMREAITRSRMARIDALFSMLPRMVRDLAGELGKQVMLEVDGGDVELDREMIEMIRDPLTHIVRNAIDHGIELPEVRITNGKAAMGRLRVAARQSGNQILIEAADDGRGIDDEKLLQRAIAVGAVSAEEGARLSRPRRLELIFAPGLSTASAVTEISGRGVGMDVVRANIERIGGTVDIDSKPGHGLKLSMRVPLTLTIIPALTVSSARHRFAIPRSAIDELVRIGGEGIALEWIGGSPVANIRGVRLPVVALGGFLELNGSDLGTGSVLVVLRAGGGERYVLAVDAVHDHEELVVKPASPELMESGIYAGTTLPDNSRPMLLLDVAGIAAAAAIGARGGHVDEAATPPSQIAMLPTLLFRDLDGRERAVRLSLAERIEDVGLDRVSEEGGMLRLIHDGRLIPLVAKGPLPVEGRLRILRLDDGAVDLAYAIAEVIDVVDLPADFELQAMGGTLLVEGRPVQLLDTFALFGAAAAGAPAGPGAPVCLIADGDDPWARQVLAPLLGASGYRVRFDGGDGGDVAVVIATSAVPDSVPAPVVRLRAVPETSGHHDDSIYRYDRARLLDAVRTKAAIGGRA